MPDRCYVPARRLFAPAKVNLGLEVLGRRQDGYHDVLTVLETVSLFDIIDIAPASHSSVRSPVQQAGEDDLILKALDRLEQRCSVEIPVRVAVTKKIPIAAGLGGGSSDAGTALAYLMRTLNLDPAVVHEVAASLGSDVPFFLRGGTSLASSTGTKLRAINAKGRRWYVIVVPDLTIPEKTRTLYHELSVDDFSNGEPTKDIAESLTITGELDPSRLTNAFTRALLERRAFKRAYESLVDAGAAKPIPAGAGPSVFGVFQSYAEAVSAAGRIDRSAGQVYIATNVGPAINS